MSLDTILGEVRAEREYQDANWGTEFDDRNTLNDWATYVNIYMAQAAVMTAAPAEQRKNMLKAATLLIAAVEVFDRNGQFAPRHYEDRVPAGTRPCEDHREEMKKVDVREELAIARLTMESLLKTVGTDGDLVASAATVNALLMTIEKLVRTAHRLNVEKPKKSEESEEEVDSTKLTVDQFHQHRHRFQGPKSETPG